MLLSETMENAQAIKHYIAVPKGEIGTNVDRFRGIIFQFADFAGFAPAKYMLSRVKGVWNFYSAIIRSTTVRITATRPLRLLRG